MSRLDRLLEFYREDPDDPFTRFALAREYEKRGDAARALEFYEALVREHPDYVGTYYHLGKLYEAEGRNEAAVGAYQDGIRVAGRLADFHARSELQAALQKAQGTGFDEEDGE